MGAEVPTVITSFVATAGTGGVFIGLIVFAVICFLVGAFLGRKILGKRYDEALALVAAGNLKVEQVMDYVNGKLKNL